MMDDMVECFVKRKERKETNNANMRLDDVRCKEIQRLLIFKFAIPYITIYSRQHERSRLKEGPQIEVCL
jgi:hypothetical protein